MAIELDDALVERDEKALAPIRERFPRYILAGVLFSLVVSGVLYYLFPGQLSRIGGSLVGVAVVLEIFAHWLQLNPLVTKYKIRALKLVPFSGAAAAIGTVFWTFGDLA